MEITAYDVEEYTIGSTQQEERITFNTIEDMESAYQDVNDGTDFNVRIKDKGGDKERVIKVPYKMIRQRLYEGTIQFSARPSGGEQ